MSKNVQVIITSKFFGNVIIFLQKITFILVIIDIFGKVRSWWYFW